MNEENEKSTESPEQVSAEEALRRMELFAERKEAFVAAIKTSENRDLSTETGTA